MKEVFLSAISFILLSAINLGPTVLCSPTTVPDVVNISSVVVSPSRKSSHIKSVRNVLSILTSAEKTTRSDGTSSRSGVTAVTSIKRRHGRRRRYDYEDVYEWDDDDDSLNYEMEEEPEEPSLLLKIARHWRTAGVRIVFIGAFLILWFMVCCGIVHLACKFWCKSLCDSCSCCCSPGVKQCCQYLYSDPMYEKVKELGDMFGIKISYAMYEKIKDHYIDDSQLNEITNPLGIF